MSVYQQIVFPNGTFYNWVTISAACWEDKNTADRDLCESERSRGREAYDKHAVTLEEGDNLGVEGKTTGLLPSRTQECGSGRIPVRVFLCACVYSFQTGILYPHRLWLHLSRPEQRGRGWRGSGYPVLSNPPLTPIRAFLPFSAEHTHSHRERPTLDLDAAYLWGSKNY